MCGTAVRVRQCDCGEYRTGSGVLGSYDARCEARSCAVCARARSAGVREWLGRSLDRARQRMVEKQGRDDGRAWKHITMTLSRDPTDPQEHTWQLLRARLRALQAGWREIWKSWKEIPGSAALTTIEIAGSGHVHMHALVLGPKSVSKSWISETIGEAARHCNDSAAPFCDIRSVSHAKAIGELAKYHAKIPSILQEKWLAGHVVPCMDPRLAARWEVATYNQRLRERYGTLREVKLNENAKEGDDILLSSTELAEADGAEPCPSCGQLNAWQWRVWEGSIQSWVGYCWARDGDALSRPLARSDLPDAGPSVAAALEAKEAARTEAIGKRNATALWWEQRRRDRDEKNKRAKRADR